MQAQLSVGSSSLTFLWTLSTGAPQEALSHSSGALAAALKCDTPTVAALGRRPACFMPLGILIYQILTR